MTGFSDQQENEVMAAVVNEAAYTNPTAWYVALCVSEPGDTAAGAAAAETDQTAPRQQVTAWAAVAQGATSNDNALTFDMTGVSGPGNASHFAVWKTVAGTIESDYLGSGEINGGAGEPFVDGTILTFAVGALTWSLD